MLTAEEKNDLGVALNEATLLGAEIDFSSRVAGLTFRVLTLPESGPPPDDSRVQLLLRPVGRVAASLRMGLWNDPNALLENFAPSELLETVQSFGGCAVYGWDFFDIHDEEMQKW